MEIIDNKLKTETSAEILSNLENRFKTEYSDKFKIKEGGILENILQILTDTEIRFQDNLLYFANQFNPSVPENVWQDALNERLGVSRLEEENTMLTLQLKGSPNCKITKSSILVRTENSNEEFLNFSDFVTDEKGLAFVDFIAAASGEVKFTEDDNFKIIRAPSSIQEVVRLLPETISTGRSRESDDDYRIRYENSKALTSQATARANNSNLGKYVKDSAFLSIHDVNTDDEFEHNCVKIIAKHNTTDNIFAQAIFDTFGSGIKYLGTTSVIITDKKGENVKVKFYKATDVPIEISIEMKISYGQYEDNVIQKAKETILEFIETRNFGLASILYATEFIVPLLTADIGIEAIKKINIKRSGNNNYTDILELEEDEVPSFEITNIHIQKESDDEIN